MAGDNRLVTENFLRLNFTPKAGVTAGTNDLLYMDCDQILARYNMSVAGVTATGVRCPSQNQITGITAPIVDPTSISYQKELAMGSTAIVSIEISTNGMYLYLMFPTLREIRRYELSTPFDIATMGAYQTFDYSFVGFWPTTSGGLFLSPDQKKLSFILNSTVYTSVFNAANDLSTELYTSSYPVSTITYALAYPRDIAFDPTGYYAAIVSRNPDGGLRVVAIQTSAPFELQGTVSYVSQAAFQPPINIPNGLEFNGDGTKMYMLEAFNETVLHSYLISPTYRPSNLNTANLGAQNMWLGSMLAVDYCWSDDIQHMYLIGSINDSTHPIIYQFSMS